MIQRKPRVSYVLFLVFWLWAFSPLRATHIRAGEIRATLIDPLNNTYEFVFVGYRDTATGLRFGSGTFDFGDGSFIVGDFQITEEQVAPTTFRSEFRVVRSYAAAGTYVVSYQEENRNAGVVNMDNSAGTPFRVELELSIDPSVGFNRTPIFTVPPLDWGVAGVLFEHNPGAFDPDGDSLSYELAIPLRFADREVVNYRFPNDESFYSDPETGNETDDGRPTFVIDPMTGTLTWDAPGDFVGGDGPGCPVGGACAEYNAAIVVEEWRRIDGEMRRIGQVTRDMQIIISISDNQRPLWQETDPLCVEAGTTISEMILADDADGDSLRVQAFGGPFEFAPPATFRPNPVMSQAPMAALEFEWETGCGDVRLRPYTIYLRATDQPSASPSLTDYAIWDIQVVGPAPDNLEIERTTPRSLVLSWDPYACADVASLQVWRRVGSFDFEPDTCETGLPPQAGYELIEELDGNATSYVDSGGELGLFAGANYCYRLLAIFRDQGGALSYVSEEVCQTLEVDRPAITHVDVAQTDEVGEVIVRWTPPYEINPNQFPPPYRYELLRSEGDVFDQESAVSLTNTSDTSFVDMTPNSRDLAYNYQVSLIAGGDTVLSRSAPASTVRLLAASSISTVDLRWQANVPWTLRSQRYPSHRIYRQVRGEDEFQLIDSSAVVGSSLSYMDLGTTHAGPLRGGETYCYYVETFGSYENRALLPEPLINRSQVSCIELEDPVPPCAPSSLALNSPDCAETVATNCEQAFFQNDLQWEITPNSNCDTDVEVFRIYFSASGQEDDFSLIGETDLMTFTHGGLMAPKGCYRVIAVDRSGNESTTSEQVCRDNCPNYGLPNAFSPNGDGINDLFGPISFVPQSPTSGVEELSNCPSFVRSVEFVVYDRTGKRVFEFDSRASGAGIAIGWGGKNTEGELLPGGTYYYEAEVAYDVLETAASTEQQKGWIQLLR